MATSGYVDTNVAPIEGESSIYPKAVRTTWNASFDEATLLWTVTWVTTALGNPSYPSQWTTYHGGTTSFTSSYTMNPASPSGTSGWIEKTRHNQELCRGSFTIAIDDDGNSSFTLNMNYHVNSTGNSGLCTASQLCSLDNKPQASTVSSSGSLTINVYSGSLSATITSKKANYHRLYYGLNESSLTEIALANNGYTASTLTASITYANILAKFPSSSSGTLYFYVRTYKDSGRTQTIGSLRYCAVNVTISASAAGIAPTISLGGISVYSSGVNGRLVAGYSRAQSVATVSSPSSSSILRIDYSISYSNGSATTSASNGTNTTIVSPVLPATTSNYTITINATVYDTRGGHTSASAVAATVFGYATPNIAINIYRTAESSGSSPARDDAGNYVYVAYSASVYSVDGQNSLQSIGCTRTGASGNIASGSFIYFADDAKDVFTVTATDRVASSSASVNIYSVRFPLELFDDKNGNMYAKSSGQFISVKVSGDGADAAILAKSANNAAIAAFNEANNNYIELCNGSSGNRGLYTADQGWIEYIDANGDLYFTKSPHILSDGSSGRGIVISYDNGASNSGILQLSSAVTNNIRNGTRFAFFIYSYNSSTGARLSYYEQYRLPAVDTNRASNGSYEILTSKAAVTVAQGGTGATTAAAARSNLGLTTGGASSAIGSTEALAVGDVTGYSAFIIVGTPSSNYQASCMVPKSALSSTATKWQVADEQNYIGVELRISGTGLYAKVAGSSTSGKTVVIYGLFGA